MKRPIVQEDDFGCGAACVAFIVQEDYETIAVRLGRQKAKTKGFMCRDLKKELSKYGYEYSVKYAPKLRTPLEQEGAIVFIRRSLRYPGGHYLAYRDGVWMDPWANFARNDDVRQATAGFRRRLPGQAQFALMPIIKVNI